MTRSGDGPAIAVIELIDADGGVEREVPVGDGGLVIGRGEGELRFPEDGSLAPRQARIAASAAGLRVEDLGGGSGVWLRLRGPEGHMLAERDQLWLGAQLLLVQRSADGWQLRHHGPDGRFRAAYAVPESGLFIGRTSDLVLDAEDGMLSRRHAQIVREGDGLRFHDRGAHNGSWLRITAPEPIAEGDELRVGTRRLRLAALPAPVVETPALVETPDAAGAGTDSEATVFVPAPASEPEPEPPRATGLAARLKRLGRDARPSGVGVGAASGAPGAEPELPDGLSAAPDTEPEPSGATPSEEPSVGLIDAAPDAPNVPDVEVPRGGESAGWACVVLEDGGESVTLEGAAGSTILDLVRAAGLERGRLVDWECGDGGCGVCVLAVVEGADRLDPPDPATGEVKTIQITEQVAPDPDRYRLACLARVRGAVRLRKMT